MDTGHALSTRNLIILQVIIDILEREGITTYKEIMETVKNRVENSTLDEESKQEILKHVHTR